MPVSNEGSGGGFHLEDVRQPAVVEAVAKQPVQQEALEVVSSPVESEPAEEQ